MVKTYSDEMTAIECAVGEDRGVKFADVVAETEIRGKPAELTVRFYGKTAEGAIAKLVPGARFSYRGFVASVDGKAALIGMAFAVIG